MAGLDLARLADLPEDVVTEGRRVAINLTELEEREQRESHTSKIATRRKALLRVIFLSAVLPDAVVDHLTICVCPVLLFLLTASDTTDASTRSLLASR